MTWLLWREYRLNRLIAIVGLGLVALPYLFLLIVAIYRMYYGLRLDGKPEAFAIAAMYSVALAQLTLVFLAGNAIAGERADRSAEFIAHLPISRGLRVVSKLLLSAIIATFIWVSNGFILLVSVGLIHPIRARAEEQFLAVAGAIAVTTFTAYCVAWLISSLQSSPTFAICGGLITPLVIIAAVQAVAVWVLKLDHPDKPILYAYLTICCLISVSSFISGTWYFMRRTEP